MYNFCFVLLLAVATQTCGDSITDGTKLVFTFLLHRHGDRTPVNLNVRMSTNMTAVAAATAPYGYGQLTNLGKQRSYQLGQFIRSRYDELLSDQYNRSEIYIRSTDSTRAKMTVLTAMAAVYSASSDSWSQQINWVPTPYTTLPAKYDFNMAAINCPTLISNYTNVMKRNNSRMMKYSDVLDVVSDQLGYNISSTPAMLFIVYDAFVSQSHLGVELPDKIKAIMPELAVAAGEAIDIICGDENYVNLFAGPLLNEFFIYADKRIAGTDTPAVRVYSAHDVNVYAMMAVSRITPRQGVPPYAAAFALELRQVEASGEYVVLPVYEPSPADKVVYLDVDGCDSLPCPYETYRQIVSPYLLDEDTWRTICGFTNEFVIDYSVID